MKFYCLMNVINYRKYLSFGRSTRVYRHSSLSLPHLCLLLESETLHIEMIYHMTSRFVPLDISGMHGSEDVNLLLAKNDSFIHSKRSNIQYKISFIVMLVQKIWLLQRPCLVELLKLLGSTVMPLWRSSRYSTPSLKISLMLEGSCTLQWHDLTYS